MFALNQIVKGKVAGTFVILAFRTVGSEKGAQVKAVNPDDHSQTAPGEMFLPLASLVEIEMEGWQIERIAEFLEHTILANAECARSYLEFCDWNIFSALDNYFADHRDC